MEEKKIEPLGKLGIRRGLIFILLWLTIDAIIFSVNVISKINFSTDLLGELLYVLPFYFVFYFGCFLIITFSFRIFFKKKNLKGGKKEDAKR